MVSIFTRYAAVFSWKRNKKVVVAKTVLPGSGWLWTPFRDRPGQKRQKECFPKDGIFQDFSQAEPKACASAGLKRLRRVI
jgi:hypothetical protein